MKTIKMKPTMKTESGYEHSDLEIKLPKDCDADIEIIAPNGKKFIFQWRIENESVDLCIDPNEVVYLENGEGDAAKKIRGKCGYEGVRQIIIM